MIEEKEEREIMPNCRTCKKSSKEHDKTCFCRYYLLRKQIGKRRCSHYEKDKSKEG